MSMPGFVAARSIRAAALHDKAAFGFPIPDAQTLPCLDDCRRAFDSCTQECGGDRSCWLDCYRGYNWCSMYGCLWLVGSR
jgi:hypothetical protein